MNGAATADSIELVMPLFMGNSYSLLVENGDDCSAMPPFQGAPHHSLQCKNSHTVAWLFACSLRKQLTAKRSPGQVDQPKESKRQASLYFLAKEFAATFGGILSVGKATAHILGSWRIDSIPTLSMLRWKGEIRNRNANTQCARTLHLGNTTNQQLFTKCSQKDHPTQSLYMKLHV